jgi:hypothetical protein
VAGADGWDRTATIAGDGRAKRTERAYGIPLELLGLRRTSISVTSGEKSIPTKNAVAIQIATRMSLML